MDQANPRSDKARLTNPMHGSKGFPEIQAMDQARLTNPVHGPKGFPEIQAGLISGSGIWPGQSLAESDDPFSYLVTQRNSETPPGKFNPSIVK
jgi:hypothetical protein